MPLHGRQFVDTPATHFFGSGQDTIRLQPGQQRVDKDQPPTAARAIAKPLPVTKLHHVDHAQQLNVRVPMGFMGKYILQMDQVIVVQFHAADPSHARLRREKHIVVSPLLQYHGTDSK
jgi:hypothetical protein